jgi:hypothetical protein
MARDNSVMQFRGHNAGSNVRVVIFPDRIEWRRQAYKPPGGITGVLLSGGVSMALPSRKDSNVIPIRMIQGVTTHRSGLSWTLVKVATAGDVAEFKVSSRQAEKIKATLLRLMQGSVAPPPPYQQAAPPPYQQLPRPPYQQAPPPRYQQMAPPAYQQAAPPPMQPTAPVSVADELRKLAQLRAEGLISDQEFAVQRARLLR